MSKTEEISWQITKLLTDGKLSPTQTIEVIANVLIREGFATLPRDMVPDKVTPKNMAAVLLDIKRDYGETLSSAMIQQGLAMLAWLETDKKE